MASWLHLHVFALDCTSQMYVLHTATFALSVFRVESDGGVDPHRQPRLEVIVPVIVPRVLQVVPPVGTRLQRRIRLQLTIPFPYHLIADTIRID